MQGPPGLQRYGDHGRCALYIKKAQRPYLEQLKNVNILDFSLPLRVFPFRQLWQGTIQKGEFGAKTI